MKCKEIKGEKKSIFLGGGGESLTTGYYTVIKRVEKQILNIRRREKQEKKNWREGERTYLMRDYLFLQ